MSSFTCEPFALTYPATTSCTILACPGQVITASTCGACTGDTYLYLYGSTGGLILKDDDGCGSPCSFLVYEVPLTAQCQQYSLQENCFSGSCSATTTVQLTSMIPTVAPTTKPSLPTVNPTARPSNPTFNPTAIPTAPTVQPTAKPSTPTAAPTEAIYAYVQYFAAGEDTCEGTAFQANEVSSDQCYVAPSTSQATYSLQVSCASNDPSSTWGAVLYRDSAWSCTTPPQFVISGSGSCGECQYIPYLNRAVVINCGQTPCNAVVKSSSSSDMSNTEVGGIVGGVVGIVLIGVFVGLWLCGCIMCVSKSSSKGNDGSATTSTNPMAAQSRV